MEFNGFHVFFLNHETTQEEEQRFPTVDSVLERGFALDQFPSSDEFATDLFEIYGDIVKHVLDNNGNMLWDNSKAYEENKADIYRFF
jgi:hypothetical protein